MFGCEALEAKKKMYSQLLSSSRYKQQTEEVKEYGVDAEQTYKWSHAECNFTVKAFYKT